MFHSLSRNLVYRPSNYWERKRNTGFWCLLRRGQIVLMEYSTLNQHLAWNRNPIFKQLKAGNPLSYWILPTSGDFVSHIFSSYVTIAYEKRTFEYDVPWKQSYIAAFLSPQPLRMFQFHLSPYFMLPFYKAISHLTSREMSKKKGKVHSKFLNKNRTSLKATFGRMFSVVRNGTQACLQCDVSRSDDQSMRKIGKHSWLGITWLLNILSA